MMLVPADGALATAAATSGEALGEALGAKAPDEWPPALLADHLRDFAEVLNADSALTGWWHWFWVLKGSWVLKWEAMAGVEGPVIVGSGGFAGYPDADGMVQIGYAVLPAFEGRGLATEGVGAMTRWAFSRETPRGPVRNIVGDTFPRLVGSIRVMEKCGFRRSGSPPEAEAIRFVLDCPALAGGAVAPRLSR
jgi:RimJ/RimL family protein N-acetyltransferase